MLFNSHEFVFFFLPVALAVYFGLGRVRLLAAARAWLLAASLFFYSWWQPRDLPVIAASIALNLAFGALLARPGGTAAVRRALLLTAVAANLAALGFYKYSAFAAQNLNALFGWSLPLVRLSLPLGISFFTFTQIAFLADAYQRRVGGVRAVPYALFVAFFPHLLAGPIVHHQQIMPQFERTRNHVVRWPLFFSGLFYFLAGLFQKCVLADALAPVADTGFFNAPNLTLVESWAAVLAYALQIYFDFAGYSNMAIGLALFFNIRFPVNFDSPYRAASIVEFWRRWHMTLSAFLRDYVYIPLGGNRKGEPRRYANVFLTMLIGGLWHGAAWTFVFWGAYHGLLLTANHAARALRLTLPRAVSTAVTFVLVCYGWVFFRSADFAQAASMSRALAGAGGVRWHDLPYLWRGQLAFVAGALAVALFAPNVEFWARRIRPNGRWLAVFACLWAADLLCINRASVFLYFQF